MNISSKTHYNVLEVRFDASPDEIRDSYLKLKNAYSQNSVALYSLMDTADTSDTLKEIEEAYRTLSDPEKRRAYDLHQGLVVTVANNEVSTEFESKHFTEESEPKKEKTSPNLQPFHKIKIPSADSDQAEIPEELTGMALKQIREASGVTVEEISDFSRISKRYLIAIELEDFKSLPARVYVRGFLLQIAKYLRLDSEKVANLYLSRYDSAQKNK